MAVTNMIRMAARTAGRSSALNSGLAFRPVAAQALTQRRTLRVTAVNKDQLENVAEKVVPVVSFPAGERQEQLLQVTEPVKSDVKDTQRDAVPFKASVLNDLTPTLKKFTLDGKVAVLTGAGRGLGLNMAQALAEAGARGIAILDVQKDIGEAAAQKLAKDTGIDVRFYTVDVRDNNAINNAVDNVVSHFGRIDILVNSAGIADSNIKAETYDPTQWRRLIDINITGSFLVAQSVARHMIQHPSPSPLPSPYSMIFIASMSGSIVNYPQEQSCYNASKAGVIQLVKSLAAEWAKFGIRVNAISPGYMDTALNRVPALEAQKKIWVENTPQKRLGGVGELNGLAVYLASAASGYMTGNNCVIDGGYTLW